MFECDACSTLVHIGCDTVLKRDINARAQSKNLKLYCTKCMTGKLEITNAEKLSVLYKYVTKIDQQTQKQIEIQASNTDLIGKCIAETNALKEKCDDIKSCIGTQTQVANNKPATFANVLRAAARPTVMIKPKCDNQNAATTSKEIKEKINHRDVNVCGMRKIRGGGVILSCDTDAASMKMKTMIEQNFGEKYEVVLPKVLKPRVKIFRVDTDEDNIVNELMERNEWLAGSEIVVKKVIKRKNANDEEYDVVLEVDQDSFEKLMSAGRVHLGWRTCRVVHHVHLTRCFKCCGYGHVAEKCTNKLACSKCGDEHKIENCKAKQMKCINCSVMNDKFKMKLKTDHRPWSNSCEVFKKRMEKFTKNFVHNEKK